VFYKRSAYDIYIGQFVQHAHNQRTVQYVFAKMTMIALRICNLNGSSSTLNDTVMQAEMNFVYLHNCYLALNAFCYEYTLML
jgi:hypothetical protein